MIGLVVGLICAVVCGVLAGNKGRSVVGWVVLGFLFGIFSLIILACLGNVREQKEKEQYAAEENRRLKEQLRQERIKGESFRQHAMSRLDAHDQHLGLDTRSLGPQLAAGGQGDGQQLLSGGGDNGDSARWYYGREGRTLGPVRGSEILELIRLQIVTRETLLWAEELPEWQAAGAVPTFSREFE